MAGIIGGGKRYIFFNSLYKTHPYIAASAERKFSTIGEIFNQPIEENNDGETKNYMQQYLFFIRDLASAERASEEAFVRKQLSVLEKDENFASSKIGEKIASIKDKDQNLNYLQLIELLNDLREDSQKYYESIKIAKQRIKATMKDGEELVDTTLQDWIKENDKLYIEAYGKYRNAVVGNMERIWGKIKNNTTLAEKYNDSIQTIFKSCFNDNTLLNKIKSEIDLDTNIVELIQNLVVNFVINNPKHNKEDFSQWLEQDLKTKIKKALSSSYDRVFTGKKIVSFEEFALTHNTGLADKLKQFDEKTQKEIINMLEPDGTKDSPIRKAYSDLKNKIEDKSEAYLKGELTKALSNSFKKIKQEKMEILDIKPSENAIDKLTDEQIQAILKTFDHIHNEVSINYAISTTSSGPSSIAEILADPAAQMQLKEFIHSFTPGNKMNLKNDTVFTCTFNPPKLNITPAADNFKKNIDNFMKNFMNEYYVAGKGSTDVTAASQVYLKAVEALEEKYSKALDEAEEDAAQKKTIAELLENTFFGGVSVKEYRYYNNDLGFHGGSLGGGGKVVNAIPNILKMYELGGITPLDSEVIIDSLLNCSNDMIGGNFSPVEKIKEYLIGGAAMLMFDEGFANTIPFLDKMKEAFGEAAPKIVHLYHLNGAYIPASYVLQNIYENLATVIKDINDIAPNKRITSSKVSSRLEIINNVTENSLPEKYQNANQKQNWNKYSQYAQDEVTIHFLFMAGILDIFEQLGQAFEIK